MLPTGLVPGPGMAQWQGVLHPKFLLKSPCRECEQRPRWKQEIRWLLCVEVLLMGWDAVHLVHCRRRVFIQALPPPPHQGLKYIDGMYATEADAPSIFRSHKELGLNSITSARDQAGPNVTSSSPSQGVLPPSSQIPAIRESYALEIWLVAKRPG
jgi:hypothetical protein